jgi:GDPmannose 4,6-dehydratase
MRTALITGVNGQDGSYLAEFLLKRGYRVIGYLRDSSSTRQWIPPDVQLEFGDLGDRRALQAIIRKHIPNEIYNLAARASSAQLVADPVSTAEINGLAVAKLLEEIRVADSGIRFCQASSSEMFGEVVESPQHEGTPFRPRNPYGVAKLFAHGMVSAYRRNFGTFACSAILFNHESPRRGTDFVTRKITAAVAQIKAGRADSVHLGSLDATRDWGFAGDYVRAMWRMLQQESPDDYVVATGRSHSVRELCEVAFSHVGLDYRDHVRTDVSATRAPERMPLIGDATKARTILAWQPTMSFKQMVQAMVDADLEAVASRDELGPTRV